MSIESISQNNYVLATQQAVTHDESLSGNGTVESPLSVVPGYNETVLYENSAGLVLTNDPSITLAEDYKNFEYIRFYAKGYYTTQSILAGELDAQDPYTDESQASWMCVPCGGAGGAALRFNQFALSASGNNCKFYNTRQFSLQGTAVSTAACAARITKIVGINRKA